MNIFEPKIDGYERVVHFADHDISGYIVIHNTRLGPALGGCRIMTYPSDADALQDALNLSKGMSYKNSLAGLNFGGGKCVVNASRATPEIMHMVGKAVEYLAGQYITAEDIGTTIADMRVAFEETTYIASLGEAGDPSPWTALGIHVCLKTILEKHKIWDAYAPRIWIQGLGKVGWTLADHLSKRTNIILYGSDILPERVTAAGLALGVRPLPDDLDFIYRNVDVYAPCAMGQVVTEDNWYNLPQIICGSANNQLTADHLARPMHNEGYVYCPDFLVNAGGVIAVAAEINGFNRAKVEEDVLNLGQRLLKVFDFATYAGINPLVAAKALAEARW